jgi:hypothetical protein
MARNPPFKKISQRGIPDTGFPKMSSETSQTLIPKLRTIEIKKPITIMMDESPGLIGCLYHNIAIASRKQTLQMKAARLSILNKAIVQKSKFLHKIALFCLINQFQQYEFIAS